MKFIAVIVLSSLPLAFASCAEPPLQRIVDEHKQQRLRDAYANRPLADGSSDGIGMYSADSSHSLTMTTAR